MIYYARGTHSNTFDYATTEKKLLGMVFTFRKLHLYLFGFKMIVYTDHSSLKYLVSCEVAAYSMNPFLQEFDLEIWDKKGYENLVSPSLSV